MAIVPFTLRGGGAVRNRRANPYTPSQWAMVPGYTAIEGHYFNRQGKDFGNTKYAYNVNNDSGYAGGILKCIPLLFDYDQAGFPYDNKEDYVQIVSNVSPRRYMNRLLLTFGGLGGTPAAMRSMQSFLGVSRLWAGAMFTISFKEGFTGTGDIYIYHSTSWSLSDSTNDVELYRVTVDASKGRCQKIYWDDIVQGPDDFDLVSDIPVLWISSDLTSSEVYQITVDWNDSATFLGPIVPRELPEGYTPVSNSGWSQSWDPSFQYVDDARDPETYYIGDFSRLNLPAMKKWGGSTFTTDLPDPSAPANRASLGLPNWCPMKDQGSNPSTWFVDSYTDYENGIVPRFWLDDVLYDLDYFPLSMGPQYYAFTPGGFTTYKNDTPRDWPATPARFYSGPGMRNLRLFVTNSFGSDGSSLISFSLRIYIDGVLETTWNPGSVTPGDIIDLGPILPATKKMDAEYTYQATMDVDGDDSGDSYTVAIRFLVSPRIDIPIPWTVAGVDGSYAQGGYDPDCITEVTEALGGNLNVAAGSTSQVWTITRTPGTQSRTISFVTPTAGIWSILPPGQTAGQYTYGSDPFSFYGDYAFTAREGVRVYGGYYFPNSDSGVNGTWQLVERTRVGKAIAASGTTVGPADGSPSGGAVFAELAFTEAGTWEVSISFTGYTPADIKAGWAVSLTDPLSLEGATLEEFECFRVTVHNVVSASSPPGTPVINSPYLITATATGAWVGKEGYITIWDPNIGWSFILLGADDRSMVRVDGVYKYWNGEAFVASQYYAHKTFRVTVTEAQTVYVRTFGKNYLRGGDLGPLSQTISYALV